MAKTVLLRRFAVNLGKKENLNCDSIIEGYSEVSYNLKKLN
jgi:hypothetical protein